MAYTSTTTANLGIDDQIALIRKERRQDENGVERELTQTYHQVYCRVQNVSRAEFFSAGQMGFQPSYMFTVHPRDYEGETHVIYQGKEYSVYRVFERTLDKMEIYVTAKVGDGNDIY